MSEQHVRGGALPVICMQKPVRFLMQPLVSELYQPDLNLGLSRLSSLRTDTPPPPWFLNFRKGSKDSEGEGAGDLQRKEGKQVCSHGCCGAPQPLGFPRQDPKCLSYSCCVLYFPHSKVFLSASRPILPFFFVSNSQSPQERNAPKSERARRMRPSGKCWSRRRSPPRSTTTC